MPEKIKLYRMSTSKYRFDLIASNRAVLGSSEEYSSRPEASASIAFLREGVEDDGLYRIFTCANDKFYFEFANRDGEAILCSQGYSTWQAAAQGIKLFKEVAAAAILTEVG